MSTFDQKCSGDGWGGLGGIWGIGEIFGGKDVFDLKINFSTNSKEKNILYAFTYKYRKGVARIKEKNYNSYKFIYKI